MEESKIDKNLYSRQIGTFGLETMGKLIQLKVFIYGQRGVNFFIKIVRNRNREKHYSRRTQRSFDFRSRNRLPPRPRIKLLFN